MNAALWRAKQKLEYNRDLRKGVPKGYTPPNLRHDKLVSLRVPAGVNKSNDRFYFLLKACPKCYAGYVYEYGRQVDEQVTTITQAQWRTQIKPYNSICEERVNETRRA